MMSVTFCILYDEEKYRVGAYGTLDIPEDADMGQYVGCELSFTTELHDADLLFPTMICSEGIVTSHRKQDFYRFRAIEFERLDLKSGVGRLSILGRAEQQECLPAQR